ncbi:hypothetical protein ACFE04_013511 [Oxalis oulophora]
MESVVASVSGYHGTERFNLIKLISQSGASYVGNMSSSTTHLVCWKFEGKKYDLAKKFRIKVVNHGWVEECLKQGKRVPERPFTLQCGQELGLLSLEAPLISKLGALSKTREVLKDRSNTCNHYDVSKSDWDGEVSGHADWADSILLTQKKFPVVGETNNHAHRSKSKQLEKSSKRGDRSNSRYYQEHSLSEFIEMVHEETILRPSIHSKKGKRKVFEPEYSNTWTNVRENRKHSETNGSNSRSKASHKGRKLVKKDSAKEIVDTVNLDSDDEGIPITTHSTHDNSEETSVDEFHRYSRAMNLGFDDIEEIEDGNSLDDSITNSHAKRTHADPRKSKKDKCCVEKKLDEVKDTEQSELINRPQTSMELSCVICWTEFSSTRGVLPCGHRFCYSCIRNWSDHMVSRGQISSCPLCKATFMSITKVNDAATSDQKIYSQTIPCTSSMKNIFILTDQEPNLQHQLVVNVIPVNLRNFSSAVTYARFDAYIHTAWTLHYSHGRAHTVTTCKGFTNVLGKILQQHPDGV